MSSSLHSIAMGLDLDLQQFTQELNRAHAEFNKWSQAGQRSVQDMAEEFDRQVRRIMEAADIAASADPLGSSASTQKKADQIALVRELEAIQDQETDVATQARMMGHRLNDAFGEGSMSALTFEQRLEAINAGAVEFTSRAGAMGTAGRNAFNQMNMAAGNTNMIVTQLGYGIEDFFTVYDNMGLAGGFRAASNNFSMLARSLFSSALMGNIVAIGLALGPTLINYLQGSTEEALNFNDAIEAIVDDLKNLQQIKEDALEAQFRLSDIVGSSDEKIRLAFQWENPEIKPTVDSSELIAAAMDMKSKLKEAFRDAAREGLKLQNEQEQSKAGVDALFGNATKFDLLGGIKNITQGWDDSDTFVQRIVDAQATLDQRLREAPESAAGALKSFQNELNNINHDLENSWAYTNNWGASLDSVERVLASEPTLLIEAGAHVQKLLDDQESMEAFVKQQKEHQQEITKLNQSAADQEKERLATLQEQQKLLEAAAEKRRQEMLEKQREAQEGLLEKAASKDKAALQEVYDAQMEILKLRQEALGDNPGALLFDQVNAATAAAMQNVLNDAAKQFGGDIKEELDRTRETYLPSKVTQDAQRAVLTDVIRQAQDANKKQRDDTEILKAIRDALQNNALVMVPVN